MRLKDVLVNSLKPYESQLSSWVKEDFEIFFMGFGNLRVISLEGGEFRQTFFQNATDICLALDELGFDFDFSERDFYYLIDAQPSQINADLLKCLKKTGNKVLELESEDEVKVFDTEKGILFEQVEI